MSSGRVAIITTHVAPAVGYGGVVESTANLTRAWAQQGHSFILCASDGSAVGRVREQDVEVGPQVDVRLYRARWFKRWGFGLGALWQVPRACWQAEVVYVNGIATWPVTLGALFAWLFRRPYVVSPRGGLMPDYLAQVRRSKPWKWAYLCLLTLPSLRHARAIVATGEKEAAGARTLLPSIRVELIVNGVDFDRWPSLQPPVTSDSITLCYAGRISPEKGINRFIRMWLQEARPAERFLVAGDGFGPYADALRTLAATSERRIKLLGYVSQPEVRAVLCESCFLVLPSGLEGGEHENFGNTVAEALASGRPVLVARGLAWDFVEAAGMGFVFDRAEASVRSTLARVRLLDAQEYRAMCERARRYAEAHLGLEGTSRTLWELVTQGCVDRRMAAGLAA